MTEFHKKEREELEKEHDKLFETLDEDRKKVVFIYVFIAFRVISWKQILWTKPHDLISAEFERSSNTSWNEAETPYCLWPGKYLRVIVWRQGY